MKKYIFSICVFVSVNKISFGQSVVIHNDLLTQLGKNESVKTALHTNYDSALSTIKSARRNVTDAAGAIEVVQQKVFSSLTNVSDGIKNVRTFIYISQYTLSTLDNISTAISLAADKPYLVDIVSKDAIVLYERIGDLTNYITSFILHESSDQLIKPTERDRFLYTVYRQVLVLDAISSVLCTNLRKWKLQDEVYNVIPINHWVNNDTKIVNNILKGWQY